VFRASSRRIADSFSSASGWT